MSKIPTGNYFIRTYYDNDFRFVGIDGDNLYDVNLLSDAALFTNEKYAITAAQRYAETLRQEGVAAKIHVEKVLSKSVSVVCTHISIDR